MDETFEDAIREWGKNPRFERAEGTKILEMREAIRPDQLFSARKLGPQQESHLERLIGTVIWDRVEGRKLQIFVIQHDWAGAFADAGEEVAPAEHHLPYQICLFEFRISGRRLAVVALQRENQPYELHGLVREPSVGGWMYVNLQSAVADGMWLEFGVARSPAS